MTLSSSSCTCCSSWRWCCLSTGGTWTRRCKPQDSWLQRILSPRTPDRRPGHHTQEAPQSPPEMTNKVHHNYILMGDFNVNFWKTLVIWCSLLPFMRILTQPHILFMFFFCQINKNLFIYDLMRLWLPTSVIIYLKIYFTGCFTKSICLMKPLNRKSIPEFIRRTMNRADRCYKSPSLLFILSYIHPTSVNAHYCTEYHESPSKAQHSPIDCHLIRTKYHSCFHKNYQCRITI